MSLARLRLISESSFPDVRPLDDEATEDERRAHMATLTQRYANAVGVIRQALSELVRLHETTEARLIRIEALAEDAARESHEAVVVAKACLKLLEAMRDRH
jgi:hypothetical protein